MEIEVGFLRLNKSNSKFNQAYLALQELSSNEIMKIY